jgi:hypothetical protein
MNTTALTKPPPTGAAKARSDARPSASGTPTFGEMLLEILALIGVVAVAGPPVVFVLGGVVLLALLLAGPVVLMVTVVVVVLMALLAAGVLVALTCATVATPYLLVRRLHGRRPGRPSIVAAAAHLVSIESP